MDDSTTPFRNELLRSLPSADIALLEPLVRVPLGIRQQLCETGKPIQFCYFIERGIASVVSGRPQRTTEIGIIGPEGMTGVEIVYGDTQATFETYMQIEGEGFQCEAPRLAQALLESRTLLSLLLRYAHAFSIQVGSTANAQGRSVLEERLARWLLMVSDRTAATFHVTHEYIAAMLAVRRSGVTMAMQTLEEKGLIRASRATIHILDRQALIEAAGGSYGLAEQAYARLVGADSKPALAAM